MSVRYDYVDVGRAETTPEGWIRDRPILSRTGVFTYKDARGVTAREWRPPEEVFHADHLNSIRGVPVTLAHPGIVGADNADAVVGAALTAGEPDSAGNVRAELVIHNPKRLGKHRHLSLGYRLDVDHTAGITPDGEAYTAIQRNLRVNHIGVVATGRAGNSVLRLDADDAIITTEDDAPIAPATTQESKVMADNMVSVRLDTGISYQSSPEIAFALETARKDLAAERLRADAAAARADTAATATAAAEVRARDAVGLTAAAEQRADTAEGERDAQAAIAAKAEADKAAAIAETDARVAIAAEAAAAGARTRIQLEANAAAVGVTIRQDSTDQDVRLAVIAKLHPSTEDLSTRTEPYIQARYDVAISELNQRRHAGAAQTVLAMAPVSVNVAPLNSARAARDAMIRSKSN